MSVTLYVAPLLDPEELNQKEIERYHALLNDLNSQLESRGLPTYQDPANPPDDDETWNAMLNNQWMINLHAVLHSLAEGGEFDFELKQFVDPAETGVHYFPIDFPEPLPSHVDEDMVYGSCQGLLREIEGIAARLGIPLERFPIDFSGDGEDKGEEWAAIYDEMEEAGAPATQLAWAREDEESVREQIHNFCESSGIDEEAFTDQLIAEHGSMEAYIESLNADAPDDEENNMGLVFTLVSHYHGCQYALRHGLTFGIG